MTPSQSVSPGDPEGSSTSASGADLRNWRRSIGSTPQTGELTKPMDRLPASPRPACPASIAARFHFIHRGQGARLKYFSGRTQFHTSICLVKRFHSELFFQLADLLTQRRLRHVQLVGRSRKIQLFGHREEVSDLSEFHWSALAALPLRVRSGFSQEGDSSGAAAATEYSAPGALRVF